MRGVTLFSLSLFSCISSAALTTINIEGGPLQYGGGDIWPGQPMPPGIVAESVFPDSLSHLSASLVLDSNLIPAVGYSGSYLGDSLLQWSISDGGTTYTQDSFSISNFDVYLGFTNGFLTDWNIAISRPLGTVDNPVYRGENLWISFIGSGNSMGTAATGAGSTYYCDTNPMFDPPENGRCDTGAFWESPTQAAIVTISTIPIPAAIWLMGSGLLVLGRMTKTP